MAAIALIKFTQGLTIGADGQALKGDVGISVDVENSDNTDVASWQIDLVYVDPASSVIPATPYAFSDNSALPLASFTPDVSGCYRLVLKVWNVINRVGSPTDKDIRIFAVPEPVTGLLEGVIVPPAQLWPRPLPPVSSGDPGNKPNEFNFSGQPDGWAGDGSDDGLINDFIRRVAVAVDAVSSTARQEVLTILSDGQNEFTLSQPTTSDATVEMYVNGVKQAYNVDYSVNDATLTYPASDLLTTDTLEVWYIVGPLPLSGLNTAKQETQPVNFDGQAAFLLSQPTSSNTTVEMYVNSGKMQYGADYTVFGDAVTYTGITTLQMDDVVEFWYLIGPIGPGGGGIEPLSNVFYVDWATVATGRDGSIGKPYISIVEAVAAHPYIFNEGLTLRLLVTPGEYTGDIVINGPFDLYHQQVLEIISLAPSSSAVNSLVTIFGSFTFTDAPQASLFLQDCYVTAAAGIFDLNVSLDLVRSKVEIPITGTVTPTIIRYHDRFSSASLADFPFRLEVESLANTSFFDADTTSYNPFDTSLQLPGQFSGMHLVSIYVEVTNTGSPGTFSLSVEWTSPNLGPVSKEVITAFSAAGPDFTSVSIPVSILASALTYSITFVGTVSPNILVSCSIQSQGNLVP